MAATLLRWARRAPAALAAVLVLLVTAPAAHAAPADPEGGTKSLRAALESAAKGHVEAKQKLTASQKRQTQLKAVLKQAQEKEAALKGQVSEIANRSYKQGRLNTMTLLLNSDTPDSLMERVMRLDQLAQVDAAALGEYSEAVTTAGKATTAIELEIKEQQNQVKVLARKKEQAEAALARAGGGATAGGFVNANSPAAKGAPRNSDGSWPKEGCTVNDPTTSGCITPRLLNAYQQARAAGFKRYTSCFSERASGEHPKGRACDFSAATGGFENKAATGGDKSYGDSLAAYLVKNADRLGVMYVIWYRQIWLPNTGWKSYSATGDPAAVHTNHVHLSIL
ncbi:hypothetical protein [Actinoplanes sp. TFC3]|uniref:coiled-coil domain-containing protein n=1 Tax=Actinoplanes sp. TFC3 TaxID=1710355 RepID=UPI000B2DD97C|nr:hypothetical protein [Actinoplanes sp. TFC3]